MALIVGLDTTGIPGYTPLNYLNLEQNKRNDVCMLINYCMVKREKNKEEDSFEEEIKDEFKNFEIDDMGSDEDFNEELEDLSDIDQVEDDDLDEEPDDNF